MTTPITNPQPDAGFSIKAVLIDLDGTLIDSAPEISRAANQMLLAMKLPTLPGETVKSFIGEGALTLIKRCLHTATEQVPANSLLDQAREIFFNTYSKIAPESKPYPQVISGLNQLKAMGLPIACVTNKPSLFTEPILKANGLSSFFDVVMSGDSLNKKKPDPDQILYICKQLELDPWEVVLIGDSNTDILAAKNAGCYVFTVPYGYNQGLAIDASQVDACINDLTEAINYIQT